MHGENYKLDKIYVKEIQNQLLFEEDGEESKLEVKARSCFSWSDC